MMDSRTSRRAELIQVVQMVCGILSVVVSIGPARADSIFDFAQYLDRKGDYYRAITEYERFIFTNPESQDIPKTQFLIADCYLKGGQYQDAIAKFRDLAAQNPDWKRASIFKISQALYNASNYDDASTQLDNVKLLKPEDKPSMFCVQYAQLWCDIRNQNIRQASTQLQMLSDDYPDVEYLPALHGLIVKADALPKKHPVTAGILSSILPGAGQWYAGRKKDAVTAFIWNALFIGGAIHAFHHDHNETGVILTFIEIPWYSANIYNAVNDAHKYNRSAWAAHLKLLESAGPEPFQTQGCTLD